MLGHEHRRGRPRLVCSPSCAAERENALRRGKPVKRRQLDRACAVCGVAFRTPNLRTQTCGLACGGVLAGRKGNAGRHAAALARRQRECAGCGATFTATRPNGAQSRGAMTWGRYCGRDCATVARRRAAGPVPNQPNGATP